MFSLLHTGPTRLNPVAGAALLVAGGLLAALTGCGSGTDWDGGADWPTYYEVTIALNVSDVSANALEGATVWVDGVAHPVKTSGEFTVLGAGYPAEWRGFKANWVQGGFTVDAMANDGHPQIEVTVSKEGYFSQSTRFPLWHEVETEVFCRETFIMERNPAPVSSDDDAPRPKPHPGDVTLRDEPKAIQLPSMYKIVVQKAEHGRPT